MPKILIKRGTATQWTNSTTALLAGELGLDTTNNIIKVGNGSTLWNSLPGLTLTSAQVSELAQDSLKSAFDAGTHTNITVNFDDDLNKISLSTGPDVVTTTSLNNTLTNPSSGYVSIADVGVADGVASLGPDGKIPDSEIPSTIARDSEIPSLTGYATETYVNTAISNLVDAAPTTLDTLNELAAALGDDANYAATISTALGLKAPLASPTFTGTVSGITKSMVGLGNVDNTSDASKPISTATQTALDAKLNLTEPAVDYYITNSGSGAYVVNGVSNGTIYFEKGKKYRVHVNATGHPFWIQTVPGAYSSSNVYNTGITNNGSQNGHILVELPQTAPQLYYACQFHSSMAGSVTTFVNESDNVYISDSGTVRTINSSTDKYSVVEFNSGSAITVTIPNDTQDPGWNIGSYVEIRQIGAGQITVTKDAAVTYNAPENQFKTRVQWSSLFLEKRAANTWLVTGDSTA